MDRWYDEGFLFLEGVWPDALVRSAAEESHAVFPAPPAGDVAAAAALAAASDGTEMLFPSRHLTINGDFLLEKLTISLTKK